MEDFLVSIANYGFPIVVSSYLLIRMEKKLDELEESIRALNDTIREISR